MRMQCIGFLAISSNEGPGRPGRIGDKSTASETPRSHLRNDGRILSDGCPMETDKLT